MARDLVRGVVRRADEHDLLTFATSIAFQVLFAVIPLGLFGLGVMGGLGLQDQWTGEWGPRVRVSMSPATFAVVDETVRRVLESKQVFWMTVGGVIAIWKVSAATRAVMDVFDRIYGSDRRRSFLERLSVSLLLGVAVGALLLAAAGCVLLGDDLLRGAGIDSGFVVWLRWPLALACLFAVIALLVAKAPAKARPLRWITFGSGLVVACWVGTSLVLGWYLTSVANYGSVFGNLATVVVVLTYLYASSTSVLIGAEVDAVIERRASHDAAKAPLGDGP
jgi:membrane protein